jgi:hypothetical protein
MLLPNRWSCYNADDSFYIVCCCYNSLLAAIIAAVKVAKLAENLC